MSSPKFLTTVLTLALTSLPFVTTQLLSSIPDCVQDCIEQSPDTNCSLLDIPCICRASSGNFLPDTITCMHSNCDNNLDNNLLLAPLQLACNLVGAPIPSSAIRNAELVASSLRAQATVTVTAGGSTASSFSAHSTTTVSPEIISATIDGQVVSWTNDWSGSLGSSTSMPASGRVISDTSIITSTTARGDSTVEVLIPIGLGASTTLTGSGITIIPSSSTASSPTSSSSSATSNTVHPTTSSSPPASTSTIVPSSSTKPRPTSTPDDSNTNSAPFKNTNLASKNELGSAFGLIFAVGVLCLWV